MATTYTSTIEVNVWKEHTCVGCGTVYRYLFKRTKTGQGGTPDAASAAAHNAVVKALANEVDMQPCPGCGLYQPDMIAAQRSRRHWWVFWSVLPILGLLLILVLADVVAMSTASWVLAISTVVYALAHLLIDLSNPNSNLDRNHITAKAREEKGDLWVPKDRKAAEVDGSPIGSGVGLGHLVCYFLLAAAIVGSLAPVGLRLAFGMRTNPDWSPEVVGPGEEAKVWFPDKVTSVKSLWRGQARVTLLNANQLGIAGPPPQFTVSSSNDSWGQTISVKSSEKNNRSTVWARVRVPADNSLVGKTVELQIDLTAHYPSAQGGNRWIDAQSQFRHKASLTISPSGSGSAYRSMWWLSFVGGLIAVCLSGILLAVFSSNYRKKALPTDIFVPEEPKDEDDEDIEERPRRRSAHLEEAEDSAEEREPRREDDRYRR